MNVKTISVAILALGLAAGGALAQERSNGQFKPTGHPGGLPDAPAATAPVPRADRANDPRTTGTISPSDKGDMVSTPTSRPMNNR